MKYRPKRNAVDIYMLATESGGGYVADLFVAPTQEMSPKKTHVQHHTIFTVDTTLSRKDRIRKPSSRMKSYKCTGGKRGANVHPCTMWQTINSSHFLCCNEDASSMFLSLDPGTSNHGAKSVLPDDPDQKDTEEYDELQMIYDSVHLGSCSTTGL